MANWCKVTAVFGFLLVASGVAIFFLMLNDFNRGYGIQNDEVIGLGLMLIGIAAGFLISKFLLDYSRNLKLCFSMNSDVHLEKALQGLRNALALIGVIWGIAAVLFLFVSAIVMYLIN